ncbi:MAG TPA: hypothetical protein VF801_04180 [Rhodocyclaceae bacterium]
MCSYDALICACPVINDWVRIDQSQADCSNEHQCPPGQACPIVDQFLSNWAVAEATPACPNQFIRKLVGRL